MSVNNFKELLIQSWELQQELLELIEGLLESKWGEQGKRLFHLIESDVESYHGNRFIHSFSMLENELGPRRARIADYREKQAEQVTND